MSSEEKVIKTIRPLTEAEKELCHRMVSISIEDARPMCVREIISIEHQEATSIE